jgi:hypothetical protein
VPLKVKPVITVPVVTFEFSAILPFVIVTEPLALSVIPFVLGIVTCVDQVHVPGGTVTVSPEDAEFMAVCTSEDEHDEALMVFARALVQKRAAQTIESTLNLVKIPILNLSLPSNLLASHP